MIVLFCISLSNLIGWSLGGYLSHAIARMLADDPAAKISVVGMLIIDSPHHIPRQTLLEDMAQPAVQNMPDLILMSFANCDAMLQDWHLPSWAPAQSKTANISVSGQTFALESTKILYKPFQGEWEKRTTELSMQENDEVVISPGAKPDKAAPPAVMLRCIDPTPKAFDDSQPCLVDMHRDKLLLGWEENYPEYIRAVIDVAGHHYSVFDKYDPTKVCSL